MPTRSLLAALQTAVLVAVGTKTHTLFLWKEIKRKIRKGKSYYEDKQRNIDGYGQCLRGDISVLCFLDVRVKDSLSCYIMNRGDGNGLASDKAM